LKMSDPVSWTPERVEKLKRLWAEGLYASEIAAQLGGVSKNAIIGKAHRLNLPERAKVRRNSASPRRPPASKEGKSSNSKAAESSQNTEVTATAKRPRGGPLTASLQPVVPRSQTPRRSKKEKAKPTFTCRGVTLLELADGQCRTYLMPGDDRFDLGGQALYCGNPAAKAGGNICAGHLVRKRGSKGTIAIGRLTDDSDHGLSRYNPTV
jgi:GcrA cell cycle regulator